MPLPLGEADARSASGEGHNCANTDTLTLPSPRGRGFFSQFDASASRNHRGNLLIVNKWIIAAVLVILVGAGAFFFMRSPQPEELVSGDPETRIVAYLNKNVRPGQPVLVTNLYNNVFTTPEDRDALQSLYKKFFMIPSFCADFYMKNGKAPTLKELSDEFQLKIPGEVEVLFRTMESDPRMPKFFERDPAGGEITKIYVDRIVADEKFGAPLRKR